MASCATQAQKDADVLQRKFDAHDTKVRNCLDNNLVRFEPQLSILDKKLIIDEYDPQSFQKKMDQNQLTAEEKKAALEYWQRENCMVQSAQDLAAFSQHHSFVASEFEASRDNLRVALLTDKITIGEFNSKLFLKYTELTREWAEAFERLNGKLATAHNREMDNRRRAAAAFKVTNCTIIGNSVQCI